MKISLLYKDGSTLWYGTQIRYGTHQFWAKSTVRKFCQSTGTGMLVRFWNVSTKRTNVPYQKVYFGSLKTANS